MTTRSGAAPRSWSGIAFGIVLAAAGLNAAASLAYTPSAHLRRVGQAVDHGSLSSAVVLTTPWAILAAVGLICLAWGLLRRRLGAWTFAVALLICFGATDAFRHDPPSAVAVPLLGAVVLVALRGRLVAQPYRRVLARHMRPGPAALQRATQLVAEHGADTLAPFKARSDVGQLFSTADDAVLAFRVENRALLVAADPVGTPEGVAEVLHTARRLARGAGLRFGVVAASAPLAAYLREEMGMRSLYLGCEAILDPAAFSLEGRRIKKVRQAHARVLREGLTLDATPLGTLSTEELTRLEQCHLASRGAHAEQSFSMAPDSLRTGVMRGAMVVRARDAASGAVAGAMVFSVLQRRSMWSLALQMRDPTAPNGVIDALVVHALRAATEQGVGEVSLNFAAARRYLHEPVRGFWPHLARLLARLATRWTQIDTLRAHNEKFSPQWEQRFLVADRLLHVPHLVLATIWQEGQLPRPTGLLAPVWPLDRAAPASPAGDRSTPDEPIAHGPADEPAGFSGR